MSNYSLTFYIPLDKTVFSAQFFFPLLLFFVPIYMSPQTRLAWNYETKKLLFIYNLDESNDKSECRLRINLFAYPQIKENGS